MNAFKAICKTFKDRLRQRGVSMYAIWHVTHEDRVHLDYFAVTANPSLDLSAVILTTWNAAGGNGGACKPLPLNKASGWLMYITRVLDRHRTGRCKKTGRKYRWLLPKHKPFRRVFFHFGPDLDISVSGYWEQYKQTCRENTERAGCPQESN